MFSTVVRRRRAHGRLGQAFFEKGMGIYLAMVFYL